MRAGLGSRAQSGSALIVGLVTLAIMTTTVVALVSLTTTNHAASGAYRDVRNDRYAGEGAIEAAVNWARDQPRVGREESLDLTDPACVYQAPTDIGVVTASCEATADSDSGTPAEGGLVPPEALLLLGDRYSQPGPQNSPACKGWWNTVEGFFANGVNPDDTIAFKESSARFEVRNGLGVLGATCNDTRSRVMSNFQIRGNMVAAGRIDVPSGAVTMVSPSTAKARVGCFGGGLTCSTPGNRSGFSGALAYLNGRAEDTDPGRPASPGVNPMDIAGPFQSVAFNQDGSPIDVTKLPERRTAYRWDEATGQLTPTSTCHGVSATIVFLPGWYRDASVLNNYTANSGCAGVTFWFAPDPGVDGRLLTDDDQTGGFYLDFRPNSPIAFSAYDNKACGPDGLRRASRSVWCIGGSSSQNPRVVVGTPVDWSPLGGSATSPGGDSRQRTNVQLDVATIVDNDLSQTWHDEAGATSVGDGQVARYVPWLGSIDRAIRVRGFTPRVTGAPIDDPGYPKGRIYIDVAYGLLNMSQLNNPTLEVAAVSSESGTKPCGTFSMPKQAYGGSGPVPVYRLTDAQAKTVADNCSSIDLINGMEVTLKVTGNLLNIGGPRVYFDGARIEYESFQGAKFPAPVSVGSNPGAAKSDCDPTLPGAQLMFGGESHVYVADGSLEVCAGPYPTDPENRMVTGIFAMPAVASIRPSSVAEAGGDGPDYQIYSPNNATAIDGVVATIRYRDNCWIGCGGSTEGRARLAFSSYSAPAGYKVTKIQARVSYNPKNVGCVIGTCGGAAPQLRPPRCGNIDFPKNPDKGALQVSYLSSAVLWDESSGRNCLNPSELAGGGASLVWAARAQCVAGVCSPAGLGDDWRDDLDGIELEITLAPVDNATPRLLPQSGCTVAWPNYGGGEGLPDCATVRADTNRLSTDGWTVPWGTKEGDWVGRLSVRGTIYAPSAAVEVDDTDNAYPIATRGAVLRHLRMSGFGFRTGYSAPAIDTVVDPTPAPRDSIFTACTQSPARTTAKVACDQAAGDEVLTLARVRFELDQDSSVPAQNKARIPDVVWWSTER